jgi:hypothetical protein
MAHDTHRETCPCGASVDMRFEYPREMREALREFREAHRVCRERPMFTDTTDEVRRG